MGSELLWRLSNPRAMRPFTHWDCRFAFPRSNSLAQSSPQAVFALKIFYPKTSTLFLIGEPLTTSRC